MTDEESTERCWLVERSFGDEDLATLVYATPDGEYEYTRQRATSQLLQNPATAAIDVPAADLTRVADDEDRERYAKEADRMRERNDPDDEV